jgi:hypothetical protein
MFPGRVEPQGENVVPFDRCPRRHYKGARCRHARGHDGAHTARMGDGKVVAWV